MTKPKVTILSGCSGSGKSTMVDAIIKAALADDNAHVRVCSADNYFEDEGGHYNFDASRLGEAHTACFKRYLDCLSAAHLGGTHIVVDNTSTSSWELSPYVMAANAYDIEVEIVFLDVDPSRAAARNQHGLSESQVRRQYERLQRTMKNLPRGWKYRVVKDDG